MSTALEAARAAREEIRHIEESLVTLACPQCGQTVGVPPGTPGRCLICHKAMKVQPA